ncbi:Uncharacterised protein [uncultured Avibacterium sp.]|uniref:Uncharacterized protein n=1 Tax=uncultured Avibacterium sp. TaxID=1936169 RepID=A0A486XGB2_9PAST|nr:Uncharacterised protein [uncultured Avibacterium sp.]
MPTTLDELQNQISALQQRVEDLEQLVDQNDDFALGVNDLLVLLAEKLIEHHPELLTVLEPKLKAAYHSWLRYEQGRPTEDDLLVPVERYQATRGLYVLLSIMGKTSEQIDFGK